jgi:Short-chain dehydrogenases of various substrate specificities
MKATLITGASSGIGETFARRLAAEKHNLVLVARSENKLRELCRELSDKYAITAYPIALDLSKPESEKILFEETEKQGFEIEWLINNAGFGSMGYFTEIERERELQMIDLNIRTLVALTHRYLAKMRERKSGVIINVSSAAGFQPLPFMATYAATKAFVTSFTQAIAEENRPFGIIVQALCPGATETRFFDNAGMKEPVKVKGTQTPEQVVEAALKGVKKRKTTVISGLANYFGAVLGTLAPDRLVTKTVAGVLRKRVEKDKQ